MSDPGIPQEAPPPVPPGPTPGRQVAGWGAVAVAICTIFEGAYTVAYRDPVGIPTICFGMTRADVSTPIIPGVTHYTLAQCKAFLIRDLQKYHAGVVKCVHVPMSPEREGALTSFAYNVGVSAMCGSTLVRRLNRGEGARACGELMKWNKAKGIIFRGLTRRRAEERKLCEVEFRIAQSPAPKVLPKIESPPTQPPQIVLPTTAPTPGIVVTPAPPRVESTPVPLPAPPKVEPVPLPPPAEPSWFARVWNAWLHYAAVFWGASK